jgi:hypothetical protein
MAAFLNLNVAPPLGTAFSSEKKLTHSIAIGLGLAHHVYHVQQIDSRGLVCTAELLIGRSPEIRALVYGQARRDAPATIE